MKTVKRSEALLKCDTFMQDNLGSSDEMSDALVISAIQVMVGDITNEDLKKKFADIIEEWTNEEIEVPEEHELLDDGEIEIVGEEDEK